MKQNIIAGPLRKLSHAEDSHCAAVAPVVSYFDTCDICARVA